MPKDDGGSRKDVILGAGTFGMWENVRIEQAGFGVTRQG